MTTDSIMQAVLVSTRFVHYTACLVVPAAWSVDRLVVGSDLPDDARRDWRRIRNWIVSMALPVALVSGAAWIVLVAMNMSGQTFSDALGHALPLVWHRTAIGRVWRIRLSLWCVAAIFSFAAVLFNRLDRRDILAWLALASSMALAASLAWAGHGVDGNSPGFHLTADAMHLCLSSLWPAGLFPFALYLRSLRRAAHPQTAAFLADATRRFSTISLFVVPLLIATGLINTFIMLPGPMALFNSEYGVVLLAKIVLVIATIAIGAVNLRRHRPALMSSALQGRRRRGTRFSQDDVALRVQSLLDLGKSRGYLCCEELNEQLPDVVVSPDKLDTLLMGIDEMGIKLIDEVDIGKFQKAPNSVTTLPRTYAAKALVPPPSDAAAALVRNVIVETILTVLVVGLVAVLGLLAPPR